jgi:hypothetical protein
MPRSVAVYILSRLREPSRLAAGRLQEFAAGSFSRCVPSLVVSAAISVEETAKRAGQIQG